MKYKNLFVVVSLRTILKLKNIFYGACSTCLILCVWRVQPFSMLPSVTCCYIDIFTINSVATLTLLLFCVYLYELYKMNEWSEIIFVR